MESLHDKPKKSCSPQEDQYLQAYNHLSKYLDLENDDYVNDPQFIKLIDGLDKKREFEAVIDERKMQLEELQKKYEEQKRELETLSKAKDENEETCAGESNQEEYCEMVTEEDLEELEKEANEKKRILTKTTSMKLGCLGMLNTIYSRLGLSEQSRLTITPEFLQKIEEAKILSKVESC